MPATVPASLNEQLQLVEYKIGAAMEELQSLREAVQEHDQGAVDRETLARLVVYATQWEKCSSRIGESAAWIADVARDNYLWKEDDDA